MFINEIVIRNLYGFMYKTIVLRKNISILVGINGSGKTSILNIINWMLKPSMQDLCSIEFDEIILLFTYKSQEYEIKATQNKIELRIDFKNITENKVYPYIQATFKTHPKKLTKNEALKKTLVGAYEGLGPEEHEKETWEFIFSEIPKPMIIGLDRQLYTEEGEEVRVQYDIHGVQRRRILRDSSPLEKVKALLN
jgi:predicted ATP-binding protein involved in virulence